MAQRRRLTDLYVIGREVVFDDGAGEPVTVFIRKLNPVEHETALKQANAARSRTLAVRKTPDSPEYLESWNAVADYGRDALIEYLVDEERTKRLPIIEAELAEDEEWNKDAYWQGLQDAWLGGLQDEYARDPEDEEALRVFNEIKRFDAAVQREVDAVAESLRTDLEARSDTALQMEVFEKYLGLQASIAWLSEYRRCEVWLSTREADRKTRYFADREEVDELPAQVYQHLLDVYREISVDPTEGKGLPVTDISSPSSAPLESQATGQPSGQVDVVL